MPVLQRKELEASPLADLHAIASELGLEGFRSKRKADLIGAILGAQGGEEAAEPADAEEREPDEVPGDEAPEGPPDEESDDDERAEDTSEDTSEGTSEDTSEGTSTDESAADEDEDEDEVVAVAEDEDRGRGRSRRRRRRPAGEEEPERVEDEVSDEEISSGLLDILANGSGFLRLDPSGQSREDVYVSPAQIRRCELRSGDEVSGPVRPPRRNERHPSLIRVEQVNGTEAEPPEERPSFADMTPVFASERLNASGPLDAVPFGKGSRVAVTGPAGAGATSLLRELAKSLAESHPDVGLQVVLAGVRPEEIGDWNETGLPVMGGSFDRSAEAQAQVAELAVERAKRQAERGGHAAVVIDALDALPEGVRRRVFGAGRATSEGGSLTIVAATGEDREALRWATTRVVLESGGRVSAESATLRADRLG